MLVSMQSRAPLRKHLRQAWLYAIKTYSKALINSERGLQVYFCAELLEIFRKEGYARRIFVEPRISGDKGKHRYPDVVICNRRQIIAVVELKYQPRVPAVRGDYQKDLDTLCWIQESTEGVTISNDRYLGPAGRPRTYSVAKDALFCWAGVYPGSRFDLASHAPRKLRDRLLVLHAMTDADQEPDVRAEFRRHSQD